VVTIEIKCSLVAPQYVLPELGMDQVLCKLQIYSTDAGGPADSVVGTSLQTNVRV